MQAYRAKRRSFASRRFSFWRAAFDDEFPDWIFSEGERDEAYPGVHNASSV
jgi:hypothetical protein